MPRNICLSALAGFVLIMLFALLLSSWGILIGGLVGGILAGTIATGSGRGTLAGFLAGVFGIVAVTGLAAVSFVLAGVAGVSSPDLLGGLAGQPVYHIALAKASIATAFAVVGGYIGGFFSQISQDSG